MGILSIGGFNYNQRDLNSVLLLPPNGSEWMVLPPLSKARSFTSQAVTPTNGANSTMSCFRASHSCALLEDEVKVYLFELIL